MRNYLFLVQLFGVGNPKINKFISLYGSAEKAVKAVADNDNRIIKHIHKQNFEKASLERSDNIIDYCSENNIKIITIDDNSYPESLKNIYDPPVVLFIDGDISCFNRKLPISVVGPRRADNYSIKLANHICNNLASCGFMLVSGLANGIDSIAHNACISNKTPTAAVLACGIDIEYPSGTFTTREAIKKNGGVIITEMLPGVSCTRNYFNIRNRIISGLSYGTLVIGGYNHSGSMLTAHHAFEQDRDLFFTLPADTINPEYSNIIKYLRDGAVAVYDHNDIINEYTVRYPELIKRKTPQEENHTSCDEEIDTDSLDEIDTDFAENIEVDITDNTDNCEDNDNKIVVPEIKENNACPDDGIIVAGFENTHKMSDETIRRMNKIFSRADIRKFVGSEMVRFGMLEARREIERINYIENIKKASRHKMTPEEKAEKQARKEYLYRRIRMFDSDQKELVKLRMEEHKDEDPTRHKMREKVCKINDDNEASDIDYITVTPEEYLKKRSQKKVNIRSKINKLSSLPEKTKSVITKENSINSSPADSSLDNKVLSYIASRNKPTFEEIMKATEIPFSQLSEILIDLELDGKIICLAGSMYSAC